MREDANVRKHKDALFHFEPEIGADVVHVCHPVVDEEGQGADVELEIGGVPFVQETEVSELDR